MSRKITIYSTKTQTAKAFESNATTLGELKEELDQIGLDYTDMTFYEGHARVELIDNDAVLPTNIPYKGQIVNDLTFMMTTAKQKIKSGVDRKVLYKAIRDCKLENKVKELTGKNYTLVSNDELLKVLQMPKTSTNCCKNTTIETTDIVGELIIQIERSLKNLNEAIEGLVKIVSAKTKPAIKAKEVEIDEDEITNMFDFV